MRSFFYLIPVALFFQFCTPSANSPNTVNTEPMLTPFEKNNNTTATYEEAIDFYTALDEQYDQLQVTPFGMTDIGLPLHEAILSKDQNFDPNSIRNSGKLILFVNNAIHAGEPCGVDASMMLFRDILQKSDFQNLLDHVVIVALPMYNLGGVLNRNSHTRTNQNGPESYGFRGNAKNLDLNRDFIKADSKNAQSFNQIYNKWQPDVFIDNHTSNGADYQYTITLIASQHNKLDPALAQYMNEQMLPALYDTMEKENWEMTPYVFARNTPDDGIAGFLDLPRYSSGYAALHNAFSFMPETHMLKPFKDRVRSTYTLMKAMLQFLNDNHEAVAKSRAAAIQNTKTKSTFALNWTMDMDQVEQLKFKGYEAKYKASKVSGQDRLYYDHNAPYEKEIPFLNNYKTTLTIEKPSAYIIPQAYQDVIDRLKWNGVEMETLTTDQEMEVELYHIKDYKSSNSPYEGHYLHREVEVEKEIRKWKYRKGDVIVKTNQASNRYIMETLEPQGPDSFFAWNFFDGILMRKEYFSPYVFEDLAARYLDESPELRKHLEDRKKFDEAFAKSSYAQLNFIFENSPHYEPTYQLYPVGRIID